MILLALIGTVTSFLGSMLALIVWFHFDLDARWRQLKINRGERIEKKDIMAKAKASRDHAELLREEGGWEE